MLCWQMPNTTKIVPNKFAYKLIEKSANFTLELLKQQAKESEINWRPIKQGN